MTLKNMGEVFLGMPGPWADDYREASDHYTTKIGGLPDWPAHMPPLRSELLNCSACGNRLCLVAQVYAPLLSPVKIEERVIYIFSCPLPKCGSNPLSWRALRFQNMSNSKKSSNACQELVPPTAASVINSNSDLRGNLCPIDASEEGDDKDGVMDLSELARAFSDAAKVASQPKKTSSRRRRKNSAKSMPLSEEATTVDLSLPVVPCFYISAQEEPSSSKVASVCLNYSSLSVKENQSEPSAHEKEETWENEEYEYDKALNADRTYLKFKKRVDAYPEQCFRYAYSGKPLLASASVGDPGCCKLCGAPRHYEMQLMPPLLYFLHEAANDCEKNLLDNWNWMTVLVYTCLKSCSQTAKQESLGDENWTVAEEAILLQF